MPKEKEIPGLFQGIMLAHLILLLHILLVACIGLLIIFFQGVVTYLPLILIAGLTVACGSAYYLFRRLKAQGKSLGALLRSPPFSGKSVEIRLLGGVASVRIDSHGDENKLADPGHTRHASLPEDQNKTHRRELIELARILEEDRENPDTYNRVKRKLFNWKN